MKKVKVRCYKCGSEFETNEGVRSDICPTCMSFIDISRALGADGQAAKAQPIAQDPPKEELQGVQEESAAPQEKAEETAPVKEAENGGLKHAEQLLEAGIWSAARSEFEESLSEGESWQAHWGIVRAVTRELTDLSVFPSVKKHAEAAFAKMPVQERRVLGARYVPPLSEQRRRTAQAIKDMEKAPPPPQNKMYEKKKSPLLFMGVIVFFVFLFIAFMFFGNSAGNTGLSAAGGIFIVADLALLLFLIIFAFRKFWLDYRSRQAMQAVEDTQKEKHEAELKKLRERLDCIDTLDSKIALLQAAYERGIPTVSSMGAALRRSIGLIRRADLMDTFGCPLAREVRSGLRKRGVGRGIEAVFSPEKVRFEYVDAEKDEKAEAVGGSDRRRMVLGSLPTVTAAFGMMVAEAALSRLLPPGVMDPS